VPPRIEGEVAQKYHRRLRRPPLSVPGLHYGTATLCQERGRVKKGVGLVRGTRRPTMLGQGTRRPTSLGRDPRRLMRCPRGH